MVRNSASGRPISGPEALLRKGWEASAVQTPARGFWAAAGDLGPAEVAPKGSRRSRRELP